jgi:hypothetical protein
MLQSLTEPNRSPTTNPNDSRKPFTEHPLRTAHRQAEEALHTKSERHFEATDRQVAHAGFPLRLVTNFVGRSYARQ